MVTPHWCEIVCSKVMSFIDLKMLLCVAPRCCDRHVRVLPVQRLRPSSPRILPSRSSELARTSSNETGLECGCDQIGCRPVGGLAREGAVLVEPALEQLPVGGAVLLVVGQQVDEVDRVREVALVVGLGGRDHRRRDEVVVGGRHLHQEAGAEQLADQRLEHDVGGEVLLEIVGRAHDGLDRLARALPDRRPRARPSCRARRSSRRCPCRSRPGRA